jgi:addiction module RelE/StbE family toxin
MNIILAPEAIADLDDIFAFLADDDPYRATVILERIEKRIEQLRDHPFLGRSGRVTGTRELVVSRTPFIVPYQVTGTTVEVLRVYHEARQWPEQFGDGQSPHSS